MDILNSKIIARAPGKLILLGEYAVLEGAAALVMAVDRLAIATIRSDLVFSVSSPAIGVDSARFALDGTGRLSYDDSVSEINRQRLKFFTAGVESAESFLKKINRQLTPCHMQLDTSAFLDAGLNIKLGLGSSAALTTTVCSGLLAWGGLPVNQELKPEIYRLTQQAHHRAQGKMGSGIDIAASVFGGIIRHSLNKLPTILPPPVSEQSEKLFILPIWSGRSMSTRVMVRKINAFKADQPESYQTIMNQLIMLANTGVAAFEKHNWANFFDACATYHQTLSDLGRHSRAPIISKPHFELARIVKQAGAIYKPSGAGGGDLGIALSASQTVIEQVQAKVRAAGFHWIDLDRNDHGVWVETVP